MIGTRPLHVVIALHVAGLLAGGCSGAQANCDAPVPLAIVDVDDRNKRLFIEADHTLVDNLRAVSIRIGEAKDYIDRCKPDWGPNWSLSFFASAERAGYKDDPELLKYVMDGSWQSSYLGEYQSGTKLLVRHPLDAKRRTENTIGQ